MGRRQAVRRAALGVALCAALITLVTGIGLWRAVFHPDVDTPLRNADVLMVLGPVDSKLLEAARLMEVGAAESLLISDQDQRDGAPGDCRPGVVNAVAQTGWTPETPDQLLCFRPIPVTTQGEAMGLHDFAVTKGWTSANVLAYPEHITRARILVDRCWTQESAYLAAPDGPAAQNSEAAWQAFWYQSGALGKAAITPGCDTFLPAWLERISWRL